MLVGMQRARAALVAVALLMLPALAAPAALGRGVGPGVAGAAVAPDLLAVTGCRSAVGIDADLRAGREPVTDDVRTTANSLATSTTPGARAVGMALFYAQTTDRRLGAAVRKVVRWCTKHGVSSASSTSTASTTSAASATSTTAATGT